MNVTPDCQHRSTMAFAVDFERDSAAPGRARAALDRLRGRLDAARLESLEIVVSELVTNSVRHSGTESGRRVRLEVEVSGGCVRLAVSDPGPGFEPGTTAPDPGSPGGWGLYLIGELVDRWWVETRSPTKVVCEISL
jgi:anti-sigma regulatory factor (Ser/Thr protein kinase)